MRDYLTCGMIQGGDSYARREKRNFQQLAVERRERYGRRPERVEFLAEQIKGKFPQLEDRVCKNICQIYFRT